jgi:Flp pilus assembly protein TadG
MSTIRSTTASASRHRTARTDAGTGLIGTAFGVAIFLLFLLFAVQVLVRLYATSALTAATFDAARRVASADAASRPAAVRSAEANARHALGSFGRDHTTFDWRQVDGDQVVLEVRARPPAFVPIPGWLGQIDRTVRVRTERFR